MNESVVLLTAHGVDVFAVCVNRVFRERIACNVLKDRRGYSLAKFHAVTVPVYSDAFVKHRVKGFFISGPRAFHVVVYLS